MPTVTEISDRYINEVAALDPVRGERWGVNSDPTRLTDYSPDGQAALDELLSRTLASLKAATPASPNVSPTFSPPALLTPNLARFRRDGRSQRLVQ